MQQAHADRGDIPSHVPPQLVRDLDWYGMTDLGSDPYPELAKLHGAPPIFYIPPNVRNRHGSWIVTRRDDVRSIVLDTEHFTSNRISGFDQVIEGFDSLLIPTEADPPEHASYRAFMTPYFSPRKIAELRTPMREGVAGVIARVGSRGRCEFMSEAAYYIAIRPWCDIMGMSYAEADHWIRFPVRILQYQEDRGALIAEMIAEARRLYRELKGSEGHGLISRFINTPINGDVPSEANAIGFVIFMLIAGVDTVGGTLGFTFKYLAENPRMRQWLREDPARIPGFVEEMLRRYATVATNRYVKADVDLGGVTMRAGDNVIIPMMLANLDETAFERPLAVDPQREDARHMTFGAGIHMCIGSRLARAQIGIAIEEWLGAIPEFEVEPGARLVARVGDVFALTALPLRFPPTG
mgnify:CR=1 FL=1